MRNTFIKTLMALADKNKNIYLATGDLGFSVFEPFMEKYPRQYLNVGVAEQNLMGVAAGLALSGKIVFAYSISTFASMRALEQIRNDICYQNLPVRIISVGGGFSYGHLGVTHYSLEDIGLMRAIPNMAVISPGDPMEVEEVIKFSINYGGPMYIRLGKAGEPILHQDKFKFQLGRGSILLKNNDDCVIFATGAILNEAMKAAKMLEDKKVKCGVVSMASIKPIDKNLILKCARETKAIFSLEEHNIIGGLGSAVAEVLAESGLPKIKFLRLGVQDQFPKVIGSQDYLRDLNGISAEKIAAIIQKSL